MMDLVLQNIGYTIGFYFLVFLPFYSLPHTSAFSIFEKEFVGVKRSFWHHFVFVYAFFSLLSLFAISLAYFLFVTKQHSNYYIVHFGVVIQILGVLFALLFSWLKGKWVKWLYLSFVMTLGSFSLFIGLIYMWFVYVSYWVF